LASGVTFLQICANPYAAILGPPSQSSARLNLAQGFNSLGTTVGPLIGLILIYKVFTGDTGEVTSRGIASAYLIYGIAFFLLAILVFIKKLPSFENKEFRSKGIGVLKFPHLLWGVGAIFFYVGAEVSVGSWLVAFLKSPETGGMAEDEATYFLSFFWGGLMIGRLLATFSLDNRISSKRRILSMIGVALLVFIFIWAVTGIKWQAGSFVFNPIAFSHVLGYLGMLLICLIAFQFGGGKASKSLVVFALINIVLLLIAIHTQGQVAAWALIGTGLFFSVGWSNIFTLAIRGLGEYTSQGSSLLVMAIVGGAYIPAKQAEIIDAYGVQTSLWVPCLALLYIVFYGLFGYKTGDKELDLY
jgi:FHS family L-fucose permease-like MFS transporter